LGLERFERVEMESRIAINQAIKAAAENDVVTAQKILKEVITQDPKNIEAWLTLTDIVKKPELKIKCLERVLQIDPGNEAARNRLLSAQEISSDLEKPGKVVAAESQTPDDRLQNITQSSAELEDPWQIDQQTSKITIEKAAKEPPPPKPKQTERMVNKPIAKSGRWLEISLIVILVLTATCVLGLVLLIPKNNAVQGGQLAEQASPTDENPLAVIYENIRASNGENVNRYMATIHSKSPSYQSTETMTKEAFSLFDLSYKISGLKILKQNKNEVVVAFTLTTQKIRGPNFRDNRISGDMILRQEDGRWKIYNQVVHDIKYLN
jgi:hypothetical protein